jgi:hypothetical protein
MITSAGRISAFGVRTRLVLCILSSTVIAISPGCAQGPETDYGLSRGTSLNGTAALAEMLRQRGHTLRTAVRLTDELSAWASGIVRFAPYPGPPEADEARWFRQWLDDDPSRWLIYVARDFDAVAEYWKQIHDGISESADPARRAEAESNRAEASSWVLRLPAKPAKTGDAFDWFKVESGASPPRVCTRLGGPWAKDVDAAAAAVWLHEAIAREPRSTLLSGDDKALVVDKSLHGGRNILIVANGSFLLNEALANPARRTLALRIAEWPTGPRQQIAFVEGSFLLNDEAGMPTLWKLMQRLPALRWVAIQMALAALLAALARAPRLGRPRPDAVSGADRPAAHAEALGALLAASHATTESLDLLERYRLWRWPHGPRGPARVAGRSSSAAKTAEARSSPLPQAPRENALAPDSALTG